MVRAMLLLLLLTLARPEPMTPEQTDVLMLEVTGDLDPNALLSLTRLVAARLGRFEQLKVLSPAPAAVAAVCAGGEDCVAKWAEHFDVDVVALTQVGKVGGTTGFSLQLLDPKGGSLARGNAQVSGLDDLNERVSRVVDDVGRALTTSEPGDAPASSSEPSGPVPAATSVPTLREPLLIGGGVGVGVGVLTALLGVLPALAASGAENDLKVLRTRYIEAGRDDQLLTEAAAAQDAAESARGQWNDAGIYAFWGGVVVAVAGGGAFAAALLAQDLP